MLTFSSLTDLKSVADAKKIDLLRAVNLSHFVGCQKSFVLPVKNLERLQQDVSMSGRKSGEH